MRRTPEVVGVAVRMAEECIGDLTDEVLAFEWGPVVKRKTHTVVTLVFWPGTEKARSIKCWIWPHGYGKCRLDVNENPTLFHCTVVGKIVLVETDQEYCSRRQFETAVILYLRRVGSTLARLKKELSSSEHSSNVVGLEEMLDSIFNAKFGGEASKGTARLMAFRTDDDSPCQWLPVPGIPKGVIELLTAPA